MGTSIRKRIYVTISLISLITSYNVYAQEIENDFNPTVRTFEGYITDVIAKDSGHYYEFLVFSKIPLSKVDFKKNATGFYLKDTSLILVFYGANVPAGMKRIYHNLSSDEFLGNCPSWPNIPEKKFENYSLASIKLKFEAYNYYDYLGFEGRSGYPKLDNFGIVGGFILPSMVKSFNEYYIINYFYQK